MNHDLTLVALNQEQIAKSKEVNGKRKQIAHAICGRLEFDCRPVSKYQVFVTIDFKILE